MGSCGGGAQQRGWVGFGIGAQSSFTALVSTVALVGILSFSIMQASDISGRVAGEARHRDAMDAAIAISNDLLANPGYNGTSLDWGENPEHLGLALYDTNRRMVLDHVLDSKKVSVLERTGIERIMKQYLVGNASLRIETLSGERLLDIGEVSGNRLQVSRLAVVKKGDGYERVKVVFALEA